MLFLFSSESNRECLLEMSKLGPSLRPTPLTLTNGPKVQNTTVLPKPSFPFNLH